VLPLLLALVVSQPADAPQQIHPLRHDVKIDSAVAGGLWLGWTLSETALKKTFAPTLCRWCDKAADGTDTLNGLDAWGRGIRARTAEGELRVDFWSNVVTFGALPVALFATDALLARRDDALEAVPVDILLALQTTAAALCLNQVVKFAVGRERPFVHALDDDLKGLTRHPVDNNLSFFSGHSSFAFSLVMATGTIAHLRGYRSAWLVYAIGLPIAAMAPLLRMGADRHYLTDVLTGSLVGAAAGWALPTLLHPRVAVTGSVQTRLSLTPGGLAIGGAF
jgi:membrane-associated phospholipid phosphatase